MTEKRTECRLGPIVDLLRFSLLDIIRTVSTCELTVIIEGSVSTSVISGDLRLVFVRGKPYAAYFRNEEVIVRGDDAWFLTLMISRKAVGGLYVSEVSEDVAKNYLGPESAISDRASNVLEPPKLVDDAEEFSKRLLTDASIRAALTIVSQHINFREHVEDLASIRSVPFLILKLASYAKDPMYYVLGIRDSEEGEVRILAHNGSIYAITYVSSRRKLSGNEAFRYLTNLTLMSNYKPTSLYVYKLPSKEVMEGVFRETAKTISNYLIAPEEKDRKIKEEITERVKRVVKEIAKTEEERREGVEEVVTREVKKVDWGELNSFLHDILDEVLDTMGYKLLDINLSLDRKSDKVVIEVHIKKRFLARKSWKDVERRIKYEIRWAFLLKGVKKDFILKIKKR